MTFDWLNHKSLAIIKGVQKTPGDSLSAEVGLTVFNLMSDGPVTLGEWSPNIPAVKNSGVWTDSPINDGRRLLAAPVGNVTEKMTILISDKTYLSVAQQMEALTKMIADCRDYWQTITQIEPVWLVWAAGCNTPPLPQFALLYNIEMAATYKPSDQPTIEVNLTLEREPYWRGIPPGANPRLWTLYKRSTIPNTTNVSLITQTDDFVYDTNVKNRFEWDTAYLAPISRNYLDIPASLIPGDAPALVELMIQATTNGTTPTSSVFVARSTTPISIQDRNGNISLQSLVFNAGDAQAPTNWTKTIDATCGCISNASAVNKYIGRNAALATGTYGSFAIWQRFNSNNFVSLNLIRGQYAIFWRCKQLNGASGDIQARFRVNDNFSSFTGNYQNLPLIAAAGATCENRFDLLYLGTVTFPLSGNVNSSSDGRGINTPQKNAITPTATLFIDVVQNNVANRSIDFLDLIFVPISEVIVNMLPGANAGGNFIWYAVDNTGYLAHGNNQMQGRVVNWDSVVTTLEAAMEIRGQDLMLIPGVNNRLYFIYQREPSAGGTKFSAPDSSNDFTSVRLNIVPRWSGIRDV